MLLRFYNENTVIVFFAFSDTPIDLSTEEKRAEMADKLSHFMVYMPTFKEFVKERQGARGRKSLEQCYSIELTSNA